MTSFLTFLALQLDRIINRPQPQSSGPKRPSLHQLESGKEK